jgi:pyridoxine 4-dehydrogenase
MERSTIGIGGDLEVGRIGFGAMRLTGPNLWGEYPDHQGGITLLRQAIEAGVTLIDTADLYGPHSNELLIREALYPYPKNLVIATKGGFVRGGVEFSSIDAIGNANYLRQCVYMSARRLGLDRIDLYYLHSGRAKDTSFEDQVSTLAEMRQQGLIRHIGLSNVSPEQLVAAQEIVEISAVTAHYNVVSRQKAITEGMGETASAALLDAAVKAGAVFVPWQPVSLSAPGSSTDVLGHDDARAVLQPIASRHGATSSQIALAWLLARSPAMLPIPGTTSTAHLRENIDAQDLELSPEEIESINDIVPESAGV